MLRSRFNFRPLGTALLILVPLLILDVGCSSGGSTPDAGTGMPTDAGIVDAGPTVPWKQTSSLPVARIHAVAAAPGNGFVYIVNGYVDADVCNVGTADGRTFFAKQNSDGSLGTWAETTAGDGGFARSIAGVASFNGYIYVGGGAIDSPTWDGNIWFTKPNADGTVGTWATATNAISNWVGSSPLMAASAGYLYLGGGFNAFASPQTTSRFYRAALDPATGEPGTWIQDIDLPASANQQGQLLFYNHRAYVLEGGGTHFYSANVASDGSLDAWQVQTNVLPENVTYPSAQIANGKIIVIIGAGPDVYSSVIQSDGSLGTWTLDSTIGGVDGAATVNIGNQGIYAGGYYYLIGDDDCAAVTGPAELVYYAPR